MDVILGNNNFHEAYMSVNKTLITANEWNTELKRIVEKVSLQTPDDDSRLRIRVPLSLLLHSVEVYQSIIVLVDNNLIGPAFALLRPQFEAQVSGEWLYSCAANDEIILFLKKSKICKNLFCRIEMLEHAGIYQEGELTNLFNKIKRLLNDYTHGGATQVMARNTKDSKDLIFSNFDPEHIIGLLMYSSTFSYFSTLGIVRIGGNDKLKDELCNTHQRIFEN